MPADEIEVEDLYTCVLSGKTAPALDDTEDDDPLDEQPLGWVRVKVQRRVISPKWIAIQEAKTALMTAQLQQLEGAGIEGKALEDAKGMLSIAADAQFYAMESDTPKYAVVEDEAFIADPTRDPSIMEAWNAIAKGLKLGFE